MQPPEEPKPKKKVTSPKEVTFGKQSEFSEALNKMDDLFSKKELDTLKAMSHEERKQFL